MLRPDWVDGDAFAWMLRQRVGKERGLLERMKDALDREDIAAKARNPGKKTGSALLRALREGPGESSAETTGKPADGGKKEGTRLTSGDVRAA